MGSWKSLDEMEECLTLPELNALVDGARRQEERRNRFMAAIQGIELPDENAPEDLPTFDDVKRRAEAMRRGVSEKQVDIENEKKKLMDIGIDFE